MEKLPLIHQSLLQLKVTTLPYVTLKTQYVVAIRVTPQSAQLQSESQSLTLAHLL